MKKMRLCICVCLAMIVVSGTSCISSQKNINEVITKHVNYEENITVYDLEDALVEAINQCEETVIGIEASSRFTSGFGSGVIIKCEEIKNGTSILGYQYYVLTNFHVVSSNSGSLASTIKVYLGKYDEEITASCVNYNSEKDIAIIKFLSSRRLPVAKIGDSTTLEKGRFVLAIGNPYDLKNLYNTVTVGNVSSPIRQYQNEDHIMNYYIQHTAPINSGNSGGGLFDIYGRLMGLNTWKIADVEVEGMGFAIPIHVIQNLYPSYFAS